VLVVGQVEQYTDAVGRFLAGDLNMVYGQVAVFDIGGPDRAPVGPGSGQPRDAVADDRAEVADVDACSLARDCPALADQDCEGLPGGHARYLVAAHDVVLAGQPRARRVVAALDRFAQGGGDGAVLPLAGAGGHGPPVTIAGLIAVPARPVD